MLLRDEDDKATILFHSVICTVLGYNSVGLTVFFNVLADYLFTVVPGPELQPPALCQVWRLQEPAKAALPPPRPQLNHQGSEGAPHLHGRGTI